MAKQIDYHADTVDTNGKVWETVGENLDFLLVLDVFEFHFIIE